MSPKTRALLLGSPEGFSYLGVYLQVPLFNVDPRLINAPPFMGLNIQIPILIPIKEGGLLIRGLHYGNPKP